MRSMRSDLLRVSPLMTLRVILAVTTFFIIFDSCKKEDEINPSKDDEIKGQYQMQVLRYFWSGFAGYSDSTYYATIVEVTELQTSSDYNLRITDTSGTLNKDFREWSKGSPITFVYDISMGNSASANFYTNMDSLVIYDSSGGLGGGWRWTYEGTKK